VVLEGNGLVFKSHGYGVSGETWLAQDRITPECRAREERSLGERVRVVVAESHGCGVR
jgi:hypothetical protein